jgi:hypothetical protein
MPPTAGELHGSSLVQALVQSRAPFHVAQIEPRASPSHSASLAHGSLGCSSGLGGSCGDGAGFGFSHTLTESDPTALHDAVPPHSAPLAVQVRVQADWPAVVTHTSLAPQSADAMHGLPVPVPAPEVALPPAGESLAPQPVITSTLITNPYRLIVTRRVMAISSGRAYVARPSRLTYGSLDPGVPRRPLLSPDSGARRDAGAVR